VTRRRVLIVEDEEFLRTGIREYLRHRNYDVREAETCAAASKVFRSFRPEVAILDYRLPDGDAIDLLPRLREIDPSSALVVLTSHGTIDLAVRAIKEGAEHFLTKPVEFATLLVVLERVLENQRARRNLLASEVLTARDSVDPFLGTSPAIRTLAEQARRIARSNRPVLIQGETGTGKSLLASWLHEQGPRAGEAFIDFNCAAFSRELVESELFGHERGAFTGAVSSKRGLLEVAHRGTIFLDEIGDMDLSIQPKMLTVLEEKRYRRVGDVRDRQVDVRLVAASHQDLGAMVGDKRFRGDLFFRISTIPLVVPSLRDRAEDVPALACRILKRVAAEAGEGEIVLSPDAEAALTRYTWPGNIRELQNVLERAVLLSDGGVLTRDDLRFGGAAEPPPARPEGNGNGEWRLTLEEAERRHILHVLQGTQGHVVEAARILGLSRSALYDKFRKHGIVPVRRG
jgi:DNA-binding NtrC family response regulator